MPNIAVQRPVITPQGIELKNASGLPKSEASISTSPPPDSTRSSMPVKTGAAELRLKGKVKATKEAMQTLGAELVALENTLRREAKAQQDKETPTGKITSAPDDFMKVAKEGKIEELDIFVDKRNAFQKLYKNKKNVSLRELTEAAARFLPPVAGLQEHPDYQNGRIDPQVIAGYTTDQCVEFLKTRGVEVSPSQAKSPDLIKRNRLPIKMANSLEQASDMAVDVKLKFPSFQKAGGSSAPELSAKAKELAKKLADKTDLSSGQPGVHPRFSDLFNRLELGEKLDVLFKYCPEMVPIVEKATKSKTVAALTHMQGASPRSDLTVETIDDLHRQITAHLEAGKPEDELVQSLKTAARKLEASGGVFGRASAQIKKNPSNNTEIDARTIGQWLAEGKSVETTEPVRYGFVNKAEDIPAVRDQALIENWLEVAGVDTSEYASNTPLLLRECADREKFSEETEAPFRERMIVDQSFDVIDPRPKAAPASESASETTPLLSTAGSSFSVEIEQAPMLLPLKYVICGKEELVHKDLLDILDNAELVEALSQKNPEFAKEVTQALNNPGNEAAMCLHRKLVAAELMNTFLEGGSAWDTAKDVAPYALGGMVMEGIKNVVPEGPWTSLLTETFLGGADLGDNGMGCFAELKSQAYTVKGISISSISELYKETFGHASPGMSDTLSHLCLLGLGADDPESKLAPIAQKMGFKNPEGPLASITKTQMKSFLAGGVTSISLTAAYSTAVGMFASNPLLTTLFGAGAIMGTSISPAIGFGLLHAELSLAVKKRLYDGTLAAPKELDMRDHEAVTKFCSKEAMNQLMMQTGNGAGNIAFLLAPLAATFKTLGYVVPQELVDAFLEPFMPGMENIVRVGAMSGHEKSKREAINKIKEKCIHEAAGGNAAPMEFEEFDAATLNRLDKIAAEWALTVASPFVKMMGRADYPHLVPVQGTSGGEGGQALPDRQDLSSADTAVGTLTPPNERAAA